MGGTKDINLEYFVEALKDPSSGLTYPAMTGVRKQSVEDVERLFGAGMVGFMEKRQYIAEAKHLRVFHNWRRVVDERGLSTAERSQYREDLLNYILGACRAYLGRAQRDDACTVSFSRQERRRYGETVQFTIGMRYNYGVVCLIKHTVENPDKWIQVYVIL